MKPNIRTGKKAEKLRMYRSMKMWKIAVSGLCVLGLSFGAVQAQGAGAAGTGIYREPVFGGIPTGQPAATSLPLSFAEAIERGARYNLANLLGQEGIRSAEAWQDIARSRLLPSLSAGISETQVQNNLRAFGFGSFPNIPYMVGPFAVFDSRLSLTQSILDLRALRENRAAAEHRTSAELSARSIRDQVALVCGDLYLQAAAGRNRITAVQKQVGTARSLYDLAVDRSKAGVVAGIEVLRAQVEWQAQQQRLIVARNEFEKQKLALARAIGLPLGQTFELTDDFSFAPMTGKAPEELTKTAYRDRADYQRALSEVRAAETARKAAEAEHLPTLQGAAHYGVNGPGPAQSHGSYSAGVSLQIPIFQGGRVQARVREADATLKRRQAEAEDLRGRIFYEVRTALLNLQAAEQSVRVASESIRLSQEQLQQAQDRFAAGVAGNIDIVQAQEALASTTETYISSLYAHQSAKGKLAFTLGSGEASFLNFLRGIE